MKIIFGGVYKRKGYDTHNDQHYYVYIPVAYKNKDGVIRYRMVDTYEAEKQYGTAKSMEDRIKYLEQANCGESSWGIYYGPSNYYYQNYYNLPSDELDEKEWEMLGDLHDYKLVDDREVHDYLKEDKLMYIPLWREDNYRWDFHGVGCHYVKKEAKKDGYSVYLNALSNYSFGFDDWNAKSVEEICKDILQNMSLGYGKKKQIKNMLKKIKKYLQLSNEYDQFCKKLK